MKSWWGALSVKNKLQIPVDKMGQTAESPNALVSGVQNIVDRVHDYAGQVAGSASSLASNAEEIAHSSQQQRDAAMNAASAVDNLSASIASVADSANALFQLSRDSLQQAAQGQQSLQKMIREIGHVGNVVQQTASSADAFVKSTQAISSMTQQVRDIAEQASLLALNTAIKAARAGEQGHSFAMVVDEVRKLAEKSAQSASEIDGVAKTLAEQSEQVRKNIRLGMALLQRSQNHVQSVASALTQSAESVGKVNQGVSGITVSINGQKQASQEIARNMENIAAMAESNNVSVMRTVQAVKDMEQLAGNLEKSVKHFKL